MCILKLGNHKMKRLTCQDDPFPKEEKSNPLIYINKIWDRIGN